MFQRKNSLIFSVCILIVILYFSPVKSFSKTVFNSLLIEKEVLKINCKIISSPIKNSNGKYYSCNCKLLNCISKNNITASANGIINVLIPSDLIEAYYPGKLYSNIKNENISIFDKGGYYIFTGKILNNTFYVQNCIFSKWENNLSDSIAYFRALCRLQFKRLMYSWGDSGGLFLALICGSKEYTEESLSIDFRKAGLSHILALSGMHLSLFSGIAMFVGKKSKRKKLSFLIRIVSLILFVWFAGFSPSLLRAFICALLILFFTCLGEEKIDMLLILCLSFIIQIIISPKDIYTLSFSLSYCALTGIILFNKIFKILYTRFLPDYFSNSLASSTSAQIFTIPISLSNFGYYCPIGIISTCFISPLVTFFIYLGLILFVLSLIFPFISNLSGIFMNFVYTVIKYLVFVFAKTPFWSIN